MTTPGGVPPIPDQCGRCIHFIGIGEAPDPRPGDVETNAPLLCAAFFEWPGIPDAIQSGKFNHRRSYPGDGGVRFSERGQT